MKRSISLLSALALIFVINGNATAQTSDNATINAAAEVIANLTVTEVQGVDFGVIQQDLATDPTIDPSDGSTSGDFASATPNVQVGFVSVDGTADQTVLVTVPGNITLSNGDVITFTPTYNYTLENLTAGTSSWTAAGSNTTADFTMTLDGAANNDDGVNTILVGGSLSESVGGNLTSGSYTGSATISVDYQ